MSQPTRLICIGAHRSLALKLQPSLSPHVSYIAILTKIEPSKTYSPENLALLLDALHPSPDGVIVGGGFGDEEVDEMMKVIALKKREDGTSFKFIRVPVGTIEASGPEGLVNKVKELLADAFAVQW
ncbi:hypothetical protein LTR84_011922 [Exophiala bonariae]|uniref:Uncharacterized protein n=1 Tax=Exophiala bonariae TaxID=1690606 RepID=A0AAV9MRK2_9EURO|nr:hypothetical protein LTR84_011922 [Exophiala bonariae]